MLVIAGKKVARKRLGWVGEFCPICRGLECQEVTRVSQVSHLYYIPLGQGKVVAHEVECRGCGTIFGTQAVPYVDYARRPAADVVGLIAATNPNGIERHNVKLELEDRIDGNELSAGERLGLIAEPIMALEYIATKKVGKGMIPTGAGTCIILLVIALPLAVIAWSMPNASPEFRWIVLGVIAILGFGTYLGFKNGGRGWIRRFVLPRLGRSLVRLRPTEQELEQVLAELRRSGYIIGKRLRTGEVFAAVEQARGVGVHRERHGHPWSPRRSFGG